MATSRSKPRVVKKDEETTEEVSLVEESKPEDEHELGLHVSIKGPVKEEEGDYMHPQDLARYELFRTKKQLSAAKKVIVEKEEENLRLKLRWQEQSLRISKLEHDAKLREINDLKKELDKTIDAATKEFNSVGREVQEKYKLTPENLIYDDVSGKLMPMDD